MTRAGFPMIVLTIADAYEIGAEFFRWEIAVAVACHILGVNAFDQPDVQDSKDRTKAKIQDYRSTGSLPEGVWDVLVRGGSIPRADSQRLAGFLDQARPGDYVAINAYLPRNAGTVETLQRLRVAIREKTHTAVTVGFGPRFQHSTGQLHKGGPNTGIFIQVVHDVAEDLQIPSEGMTFGTFIRAQALGDYETLVSRGRRVMRVRLSAPDDIALLVEALQ
jgi:hypothetical protein